MAGGGVMLGGGGGLMYTWGAAEEVREVWLGQRCLTLTPT